MLLIKSGVKLTGLKPEILLGILVVREVFREHNINMVITSCMDGKHKVGSLHYKGYAVDIRTRNIPDAIVPVIINTCRINLGSEYDLVLEKDHIHLEFDSKG